MNDRTRLPGQRTPPAPAPFQPGSLVVLRNCPDTLPGVVKEARRNKIAVYWSDLRITTKHRADALTLAESKNCAAEAHS